MKNSKTLVVGPSGSGKTTLLQKLITDSSQGKVVIYDTQADEFPEFVASHKGITVDSLPKVWEVWNETRMICLTPNVADPTTHDFGPEFLELLSKLFKIGAKIQEVRDARILIVADEADTATSGIDDDRLKRIIQVSRRNGLDYLFAAHRLAEIPPAIRDQMTVLHHFAATDPTTLKMIGAYTDPEEITSLKLYEHRTIKLR